LHAFEVSNHTFSNTALLILSACSTSDGEVEAGEGVQSLSNAALSAGIPAVLGGLWEVGDGSTVQLMREFHRRVKEGGSPVEALRGAQLTLLSSENDKRPESWAAFQLTE
jgi:CHAT domain-containing protein